MIPREPETDPAPDEPLVSDTDPTEPDEGVENIKEEGEPFPGNFA
jgi:hypothetical protein